MATGVGEKICDEYIQLFKKIIRESGYKKQPLSKNSNEGSIEQ